MILLENDNLIEELMLDDKTKEWIAQRISDLVYLYYEDMMEEYSSIYAYLSKRKALEEFRLDMLCAKFLYMLEIRYRTSLFEDSTKDLLNTLQMFADDPSLREDETDYMRCLVGILEDMSLIYTTSYLSDLVVVDENYGLEMLKLEMDKDVYTKIIRINDRSGDV